MTHLLFGQPEPARATELPQATRLRWQPIRGGLLNLYLYDYEEFRYENGHLILRGNNGTGKSRVMALQLPFLLDGHLSANRVEPDADPSKRMDWNLLMGSHSERLGYTWIEFGRFLPGKSNGEVRGSLLWSKDHVENGCIAPQRADQQFVTLGCGLSATKGSGMREPWFFITSQRIGEDLFLQSPAGHPLSKSALVEAIGDQGTVYTTAKEYRLAVDEALFGLGKQRYEAMVDLLIQLRRPQLSRQLDEKNLARVLGESLPPPSEQMIIDVAESFRSLESDRRELNRFLSAHNSVESFLRTYRRYAQIAARRRAADVRQSHNKYESESRDLRTAEGKHAESVARQEEATEMVRSLEVKGERLDSRVATLQADPRMRGAEAIRKAAEHEQVAQDDLGDAQREKVTAQERLRQRQAALGAALRNAERQLSATTSILQRLAGLGDDCDFKVEHESAFADLNLQLENVVEGASWKGELVRRDIEGTITTRNRSCAQVKQLNSALQEVTRELAQAQKTRDDAQRQVDQAIEAEKSADGLWQQAVEDYLEAYRMWRRDSDELNVPSADELAGDVEDWSMHVDGFSPIATAVRDAELDARQKLSDEGVRLQDRLNILAAARIEAEALAEKFEAGFHEPPPLPFRTDELARAGMSGAPLWSLVDFSSTCSPTVRANVEAALEAAGILNAWVTSDGSVLTMDFADVLISSGQLPDVPGGSDLTTVLTPDLHRSGPRHDVSDEVIAEVLRKIGFGEYDAATWISSDGRWRNGPLHGQCRKELPQYIGLDAREDQRARNLAIVQADLIENQQQAKLLERKYRSIEERLASVTKQVEAAPSDSEVRAAAGTVAVAAQRAIESRAALTSAEHVVVNHRSRAVRAREIRDRDASDLGLIAWVDRLDELVESTAEYRNQLAELWPSIEHFETLRTEHLSAATTLDEADRDAKQREAKEHEMTTRHAKANEHLATLRKTVGVDAEEILRQLAAVEDLRRKSKEKISEARSEESEAAKAMARTEERIQSRRESIRAESERRQQSCAAFQKLCALGLLKTATLEVHDDPSVWSVSRTVEVARQTESAFSQVNADDAAWNRIQQSITSTIQELNTALSQHAFTSTLRPEDGLYCVTVPYQGREHTVHELRELLAEEVSQRQLILDEREREIIENHLIGEVAAKLHEQIHEAHELVGRMNAEIQQRPMSTGMTLKFDWKPDEELATGIVEMCKKLLAATGTWSPPERAAIGRYLQQHIKDVRASRETGTWQEHLAEALDYRRWHRFWVMRKQESGWKRLTKRTHGTGSGGEKAVALMIPQFAAAAAHYSSARDDAPRLILLDEAFVGIDPDMRGKCMELIKVFDLDFLLTSESEWGCYAGLPGVAIYQLSTRSGFDAVFLTRWIWNGKQRLQDHTPLPPAALGNLNGAKLS